jgi:hypothetical protein
MSLKDNAIIVENTGGQLKYIKNPVYNVDENGLTVDFTDTERFIFEDNRLKCSHMEIFNDGPNDCIVAFDTDLDSIDIECWDTYAYKIYSGKPYNYISHDGEAGTMSLITAAGETAKITIMVW